MSGHARLWKPIAVAALIAGALDLVYAVIHIGSYYHHQMLYGTLLVHMFAVGLVISACARFMWPKQA